MTNLTDNSGPIEVWLTKKNIQVVCNVVFEDETACELDIHSLSMRGAQREITSFLVQSGYAPAGRWEAEETDDDGNVLESMRQFKLAQSLAGSAASVSKTTGRLG